MNKQLTYYFIFSITIGTSVYVLQKLSIALPSFVQNYLNDFLIIPIVLYLCLLFLQWSKNDKNYQISLSIILYLCGLYSLIFEWILPSFHNRYTADYIDAILYFTSGLLFYSLQRHYADRP